MSIAEKIGAYHGALMADEHHRYRSWERCYDFFRRTAPVEIAKQRDAAALQLGFYLASWGMYRGSSFLLQRAYTVHLRAVDRLVAPRLLPLWEKQLGAEPAHASGSTFWGKSLQSHLRGANLSRWRCSRGPEEVHLGKIG